MNWLLEAGELDLKQGEPFAACAFRVYVELLALSRPSLGS